MTENHRFDDHHEEILFYKTIKPQFAAQIKYFTLLYASEVFAPEDIEKKTGYWHNEQKKCLEFFERHEAFYQYYKNGMTNQDAHYFIPSSSYIDILASFIAREKYLGYLQSKINARPAVQSTILPAIPSPLSSTDQSNAESATHSTHKSATKSKDKTKGKPSPNSSGLSRSRFFFKL